MPITTDGSDPRSDRDALIAATAFVHGITVVIRNIAHFEFNGLRDLEPLVGWRTSPRIRP